jgi:hypothetical protein
MKQITFEMAQDMGLIPYPTKRYFGWEPFMSAYAVEKKDEMLEAGYKAEYKQIKDDYKFVCLNDNILEVV